MKHALTLADLRAHKCSWVSRVPGWVSVKENRDSSFRAAFRVSDALNGGEMFERLLNRGALRQISSRRRVDTDRPGAPIEIRVSPDAIVEVYEVTGASGPDYGNPATEQGGADWMESREAREESDRAFSHYRRVRRAQTAGAYLIFAAVAAFAIWCAVR
jgi:hypothetical protein